MNLKERLERIEAMLLALVQREPSQDWYSIEQFSRIVGRSVFTCRE